MFYADQLYFRNQILFPQHIDMENKKKERVMLSPQSLIVLGKHAHTHTHIYITESFFCTLESKTLKINYTSAKNKI